MNDVSAALSAYRAALQRSAKVNEEFADHVVALARIVEASAGCNETADPLLALARRHRVEALKDWGKIAAMNHRFIERSGADEV